MKWLPELNETRRHPVLSWQQVRAYWHSTWTRISALWGKLPGWRERLDYQAYLLAGCGMISSLLLALGHLSTSGSIEKRLAEDLQASLQEVLPPELYDNDLLHSVLVVPAEGEGIGRPQTEVYLARKQNQLTGVAFTVVAPDGYSGAITLMIGVDPQGKLLGVRTIKHNETPGLGDKVEVAKSDWVLRFVGHSLADTRFQVKKDSGDFDQFTGATITPRAVVKAVAGGLQFFVRHHDEWAHTAQ